MPKMNGDDRPVIRRLDEGIDALSLRIPKFLDTLRRELEVLTGKTYTGRPSAVETDNMAWRLRALSPAVARLEELASAPLSPEVAQSILDTLATVLTIAIPAIPEGRDPIDFTIDEMIRYAAIPENLVLDDGLDYISKHTRLQTFLEDLVESVDGGTLDGFLRDSAAERHMLPQLQRVFGGLALPQELDRVPLRMSLKRANRLQQALREVTADWEAFVGLVFGFCLLKQRGLARWESIRRTSLAQKVARLRETPELVHLAKTEWVTVRNSLAHGSAYFDPRTRSVEFRDRAVGIAWEVRTAYREGQDIFLANSAMLAAWNMINAARAKTWRNQIELLRGIAARAPVR